MHTKIDFFRRQMDRAWRHHGHFISAVLCGLLFGALFGSHVDLYRAATVAENNQSQELLNVDSARVVPRGERVQESVSFTVAVNARELARFTPLRIPAMTKTSPRIVVAEITSSTSSASSDLSASSASSRKAVVRPPREIRVPVATSSSSVSSSVVSSSASSAVAVEPVAEPQTTSPEPESESDFPTFGSTRYPVSKVPNWGAMTTPAEWNRSYSEMTDADFVPLPRYDLGVLKIPMQSLLANRDQHIAEITAKLTWSTRYMGTYDLDAGEHTGIQHPGIDIKLASGTPIGAVAGGRVYAVRTNETLGKHVIIEHRKDGQVFFSLYGHLHSSAVSEGQDLKPGATIGYVGMTGKTVAPHLHWEVNKGFLPDSWANMHAAAGAGETSVNPVTFVASGGNL